VEHLFVVRQIGIHHVMVAPITVRTVWDAAMLDVATIQLEHIAAGPNPYECP